MKKCNFAMYSPIPTKPLWLCATLLNLKLDQSEIDFAYR